MRFFGYIDFSYFRTLFRFVHIVQIVSDDFDVYGNNPFVIVQIAQIFIENFVLTFSISCEMRVSASFQRF